MRFRFAVALLAPMALLLGACEEIEEEKPWIQVERPQMLFTDTTLLDSYDKDVLNWKLKTAYLERWADKEIVFVRPVLVDIFDSLGERVAFLRADSGSMDMKFTYVSAFGHVYALTPKGASVRADSLLWNKKDNLVRTESYVRVVSEEGDVLQGKGFESDAKMDHWKILSDVTGIFQDAAKRLKEEDKKESVHLENASSSSQATSSSAQAVSSSSRKASPLMPHRTAAPPQPKKMDPNDSLAMEENRKAKEKVDHMNMLRAQARQRMQGTEGEAKKPDEAKKPEEQSKPAKTPEPQKSGEAK
jgi:LPS export ABC transporter protein LptC